MALESISHAFVQGSHAFVFHPRVTGLQKFQYMVSPCIVLQASPQALFPALHCKVPHYDHNQVYYVAISRKFLNRHTKQIKKKKKKKKKKLSAKHYTQYTQKSVAGPIPNFAVKACISMCTTAKLGIVPGYAQPCNATRLPIYVTVFAKTRHVARMRKLRNARLQYLRSKTVKVYFLSYSCRPFY